jgi:hypothetical protein
MKIYKIVSVFVAVVAMSLTFISCDRDNDITGNPFADHTTGGVQDYWINFELSNPGSLSEAAKARFTELVGEVIYGDKNVKIIDHPMYNTEEYVRNNFNAVKAIPAAESDIVQKIMIPTFCVDTVGGVCHDDFEVKMTLSKDSMRTELATFTWNAKTAFDGPAIIAANSKK